MSHKYIGVYIKKNTGKHYAQISPTTAERAGLPEELERLISLRSNSFEDEKDAAKAADK